MFVGCDAEDDGDGQNSEEIRSLIILRSPAFPGGPWRFVQSVF